MRESAESDNDNNSVKVKKLRRLTPDIIFGGLQLSRKNAAAIQLDCKEIESAVCNGGLGF